jgi:hypothetical protein
MIDYRICWALSDHSAAGIAEHRPERLAVARDRTPLEATQTAATAAAPSPHPTRAIDLVAGEYPGR